MDSHEMDVSDSQQSTSIQSKSASWRLIDYFAVGLWLALPISVYLARQLLLPIFIEFDFELPTVTKYLLNFSSPILLAIGSLIVVLVMGLLARGTSRSRFAWAACILALLIAVVGLLFVVSPAWSLMQELN